MLHTTSKAKSPELLVRRATPVKSINDAPLQRDAHLPKIFQQGQRPTLETKHKQNNNHASDDNEQGLNHHDSAHHDTDGNPDQHPYTLTKPLNVIELCAGAGGLALGLEKAGFKHLALIEKDLACCNNLRANLATCFRGLDSKAIINQDIRDLDYKALLNKLSPIPTEETKLCAEVEANEQQSNLNPSPSLSKEEDPPSCGKDKCPEFKQDQNKYLNFDQKHEQDQEHWQPNNQAHEHKLMQEDGFDSSLDLLAGGPPCQPFSTAGKARGKSDVRDMFPEAIRAVKELKPKAFIFENVMGLLRPAFKEYFEYLILQLSFPSISVHGFTSEQQHYVYLKQLSEAISCDLENTSFDHDDALKQEHESYSTLRDDNAAQDRNNDDANAAKHRDADSKHRSASSAAKSSHPCEYHVSYYVLNAADYGVAQIRHRVFIVGWRSDLKVNWSCPKPTHADPTKVSKSNSLNINLNLDPDLALEPWSTVFDAIGDLPRPIGSPQEDSLTAHASLIPSERPVTNKSSNTHHNHSPITNHVFKDGAKVYPGHTGSTLNAPSKTIKAGVHGVPGGENMITFKDGSCRYYTVREAARIQSFPDEYVFNTSWTQSMKQIGNAVPVQLAYILGKSIYEALSKALKES